MNFHQINYVLHCIDCKGINSRIVDNKFQIGFGNMKINQKNQFISNKLLFFNNFFFNGFYVL